MNYYPYIPVMPTRPSLFGIFKGFNFGSILSGTQKALNLANQAIPLIKQVSPVFQNAKTMFRVMNEFRKTDSVSTVNRKTDSVSEEKTKTISSNKEEVSEVKNVKKEEINGPTFFV